MSTSPTKKSKLDEEEPKPIAMVAIEKGTVDQRVVGMKALYPPSCVLSDYPLQHKTAEQITKWRAEIDSILRGDDDRLIAVVGPCSIHDPKSGIEYAKLLKPFADSIARDVLVVMRVYFEKPRTTVGWKGLINDPDLDGSYNINKGIRLARQFLLDVNELGLPVGTEFLDTISAQFTSDLVSWGAIGARTTESQVHRELASGLSCPIGFKNGTAGSVQVAVDAVQSARCPHSFLGVSEWGNAAIIVTKGNKSTHIILRGGSDGPNFSKDHVDKAAQVLSKAGIAECGVMVDCSHANSQKNHRNQPKVADELAKQVAEGSFNVIGVMIESNLKEGAQKLDPGKTDVSTLVYGQSVTDACVDFPATEKMLSTLAEAVRARRLNKKAAL